MGLSCGLVPQNLRQGGFVPLAAGTAQRVTIEELQDTTRLERFYRARKHLQNGLRRALPLETELKEHFAHSLDTIQTEITRFELTPEFDLPTIHPSFLQWKTHLGYPAFSIYTLDDPTCTIHFERFGRGDKGHALSMTPTLPPIMAKHYLGDALVKSLNDHCLYGSLQSIDLGARYAGAMPDSVREHIHYYIDEGTGAPRFEQIFIVAEAPVWDLKTVRQIIPAGDPLVIGVKENVLWLIDSFDLTPVEQAALSIGTHTELHATN